MSKRSDGPENWVVAVLRAIRPAPNMFIGGRETRLLLIYLNGYLAALQDHGIDADWSFMQAFYEWLSRTTGKSTSLGVMGLIEEEDCSPTNIVTFFARLDEFLEATGRPKLDE